MSTPPGHYFDAEPTTRSQPSSVTLALPDRTVQLLTDRGVFAGDRVDAGTKYLLLDGPPLPEEGDILDLGCGYGAIACTLAARSPGLTVWAIDVNRRARELCARNATTLGLSNVRVVAPEEVPDDIRFAAVWSNPPIRIGKPALHQLLRTWLARLRPDGYAALVVSKHLGSDSLAIWLQRQGWPVERLGSRQGYRILHVDAAAGTPP
jgi:16S rRNA (guanine1207-N2)-methyltransferase